MNPRAWITGRYAVRRTDGPGKHFSGKGARRKARAHLANLIEGGHRP